MPPHARADHYQEHILQIKTASYRSLATCRSQPASRILTHFASRQNQDVLKSNACQRRRIEKWSTTPNCIISWGMLSDLGGAASIGLVRIGDALGLYKILHARGAMTAGKLAVAAGSTSDTFASGCRIRPLRTISPKIPQRGSLNCRRSKGWFSL